MICRERCVSKIVPDAMKSADRGETERARLTQRRRVRRDAERLTENWRGYFVGGAGWKSESERVVSAMAPWW